MVNITFPDGNIKAFENPLSGIDAAKSISDGFARSCVAMELDDNLVDLSTVIDHDAKIRFVTSKDPDALEILRHSAAHVMAQAILRLYKDAKLTIGPAVEDGFYYDIDMEAISEDDFPKSKPKCKRSSRTNCRFDAGMSPRREAMAFYKDEPYKLEIICGS